MDGAMSLSVCDELLRYLSYLASSNDLSTKAVYFVFELLMVREYLIHIALILSLN